MKFKLYNDIKMFYQDTYDILMRNEAQNLIPLGNVIMGNAGNDKTDWRDPANWFMATVSDDSGIRLTAIMTPPHNLTLYATDNQNDDEAIICLIDGMMLQIGYIDSTPGVSSKTDYYVPGVMTEKSLAEDFTRLYTARKGVDYTIHKEMRIHQLLKVNPDIPTVGTIRLVQEKDMSFLPYWHAGFHLDCFDTPPALEKEADACHYLIGTKSLYVLEVDGIPVSISKMRREMQSVCGIGLVYTPPYFRGKGYATSCVAMVSQVILERGFTKSVLYTDLANPISNSIYKKIGYEPIADALEIKFA